MPGLGGAGAAVGGSDGTDTGGINGEAGAGAAGGAIVASGGSDPGGPAGHGGSASGGVTGAGGLTGGGGITSVGGHPGTGGAGGKPSAGGGKGGTGGAPGTGGVVGHGGAATAGAPGTSGTGGLRGTGGVGAGGMVGSGGVVANGGSPGTGGVSGASCTSLATQYDAEVNGHAKACYLSSLVTCTIAYPLTLSCVGGCDTWVADESVLKTIVEEWNTAGCDNTVKKCVNGCPMQRASAGCQSGVVALGAAAPAAIILPTTGKCADSSSVVMTQ